MISPVQGVKCCLSLCSFPLLQSHLGGTIRTTYNLVTQYACLWDFLEGRKEQKQIKHAKPSLHSHIPHGCTVQLCAY